MNAKIICLDFDDTINNYPGWQQEGYAEVRGEPVQDAKENIKWLRDSGYIVLVHSVRCGYTGGMVAVVEYLNKYNIRVDGVCSNKPPADIYLDDRSVTFKGDWIAAVNDIKAFSTWKDKLKAVQASGDYHTLIGYKESDRIVRQCSTCKKRLKPCGKGECFNNEYNEWESQ